MRGILVFAVAALTTLAIPAQAATITDGDFSTWSFSSTFNPPSFATVVREPAGGNPDARLNITTFSGPTIYGNGIKTDYSTTAALEGAAFTLGVDFLSGPGATGDGQAVVILVQQGADIYGVDLGVTGTSGIWTNRSYVGTFTAASFTHRIGGGPATPDFGGGIPTQFGFAGGNSSSGTLTNYYDNFSLTSTPLAAPIPEPSTVMLMLAGFGFVIWFGARRKAAATAPQTL